MNTYKKKQIAPGSVLRQGESKNFEFDFRHSPIPVGVMDIGLYLLYNGTINGTDIYSIDYIHVGPVGVVDLWN